MVGALMTKREFSPTMKNKSVVLIGFVDSMAVRPET